MASAHGDEQIRRLRDEHGLTFQAIATRTELSKKSVQMRYYKLADCDQERISQAYALRDAGLAPEAIARELAVHVVTVARWTNSQSHRGRSGDPEVQKRLVELVSRSGMSIALAGKELSLSKSAAWHCYRRAFNVDTSPPSRTGRDDPNTARILELRDRDHLSWRVIASRVNMSPSGVRRRYYTNSDAGYGVRQEQGGSEFVPTRTKPGRRVETGEAITRRTADSAAVDLQPTMHRQVRTELVVRLRDEGMSFVALATEIGSKPTTVRALYYAAADADTVRMSRAREMCENGLTHYEIASQLGVHEATVARWTGQVRPGRRRDSALSDKILQMRDKEGMGFAVIARELGLSQPDVRRRYRTEIDRALSRIKEARALHEAGYPISEISQRIGVHAQTILRWTAPRPIRGRPRRLDVADETIQFLHDDQQLTFRAISERTGLSEPTVWRRYKRVARTSQLARSAARRKDGRR